MTDAIQIINSIGFPIFCVLALGIFVYRTFQRISDENKDREAKLYEMVGKLQEQLANSIETNSRFVTRLEAITSDIDDIKTLLNMSGDEK